MVFPCQVGSAFATSGCDPKRTAKKMMSALTASASVSGMIAGPIAAASAAKLSGARVVATDTSMPLRANALARALPILPKPIIAELIEISFVFSLRSEPVAAARLNRLAGHPVAFIGSQESHDGGDFRRLAKASQRNLGLDRAHEFGILPEGSVPVGSRVARRYGVRGNSARPQLRRERVRQVVDGRFGHRVNGRSCHGLRGGSGRDVDDACTIGETTQSGLNDEERRARVDRDQGVPTVQRRVLEANPAGIASVVDQNVQGFAAVAPGKLVVESLEQGRDGRRVNKVR